MMELLSDGLSDELSYKQSYAQLPEHIKKEKPLEWISIKYAACPKKYYAQLAIIDWASDHNVSEIWKAVASYVVDTLARDFIEHLARHESTVYHYVVFQYLEMNQIEEPKEPHHKLALELCTTRYVVQLFFFLRLEYSSKIDTSVFGPWVNHLW